MDLLEGGQFPLWIRLPKRGFSNFRHATRFQAVSLARVAKLVEGNDVDLEALIQAGLANQGERIKIVGGVKLDRALNSRA